MSIAVGKLTPSLPAMSLENDPESAKFETLKPFCLIFRTGM